MTPEAKVKKYLREQCSLRGWECLTLVDTVRRKWPDRTIIAPGARVAFVEVKAEGVSHNPKHVEAQLRRLEELRTFGFLGYLITGKPGVDSLMEFLDTAPGWWGSSKKE
jgi:hypothetical protein